MKRIYSGAPALTPAVVPGVVAPTSAGSPAGQDIARPTAPPLGAAWPVVPEIPETEGIR